MSRGGRAGTPHHARAARLLGLATGLLIVVAPQVLVATPAAASSIAPAARAPVSRLPKRPIVHWQLPRLAEAVSRAAGTQAPISASTAPVLGGAWSDLGPRPVAAVASPDGELSGRVTALAVDPTNPAVAYAGTADGGVWKTTSATSQSATWIPLTDSQPTLAIGALAIDPNNPSTIYAGTGEANDCSDCLPSQGVLKSVDGGSHWTLLAGSPQHGTAAIVVDRSNTNNVLVATTRGLYQSTDGGVTWTNNTQILSVIAATSTLVTGGIDSLVQDPVNPRVFWAAVADWCATEGREHRGLDELRGHLG